MPAELGLQQTTRAPSSDKTRGQWSFGPLTDGLNLTQKFKKRNGVRQSGQAPGT